MSDLGVITMTNEQRVLAAQEVLLRLEATSALVQGIGPNGPQIIGLEGNWGLGQAVLVETNDADLLGVFKNDETGHNIDFHWGFTSENPKEKGQGLAKLLRWHPNVVATLDQIIKVSVVVSQANSDRYVLSDGVHLIVVSQTHNLQPKRWLVTAFNVGRKPSKRDRTLLNFAKNKISQATSRTVDGASVAGQTNAPIAGANSTDRLAGVSLAQDESKINDK
jgi:hypothetical protein